MDYIVAYPNVNNVNIHCLIQEKDALIERLQKENEELRKTNQLVLKENEKLKNELDMIRKLNEALEKFKYSLERNVQVLKEYDKNRWSISDAESEVKIWEHEYLMVKRMMDKKEKEEAHAAAVAASNATNINSIVANQTAIPQVNKTMARRSKPKLADDGTAIKRYVCDYPNCNYRSNWAHDLKGHKRKHTGEKPYACAWLNCNKSFRDLRDLKRHQRAHTGDKRYSCDWPGCDYRSTDVANLAKHKRTHTGEKPYKCDWAGCDACFADGSHLRRHQKKHENQISKSNKGNAVISKKRQSNQSARATPVKIRQQPGRKAKGSTIPLEIILNVNDECKQNDMKLNIQQSEIRERNGNANISVIVSNDDSTKMVSDVSDICHVENMINDDSGITNNTTDILIEETVDTVPMINNNIESIEISVVSNDNPINYLTMENAVTTENDVKSCEQQINRIEDLNANMSLGTGDNGL